MASMVRLSRLAQISGIRRFFVNIPSSRPLCLLSRCYVPKQPVCSARFPLVSLRNLSVEASVSDIDKDASVSTSSESLDTQSQSVPGRSTHHEFKLGKQLSLMDRQLGSWSRIDIENVEKAIRMVQESDHIKGEHALMLLRCMGSFLPREHPKQRMALFHEAWDAMEKIGFDFTVSHYNIFLRTQIENEVDFSPAEFLEHMQTEKNIMPNVVTFQLLIDRFCELGDVEGAKEILEYMKNHDIAVNESVVNSLIKGYLKNGDEERAQEVLKSKSELGLHPSPDTFAVFLYAYAEKGDLYSMKQVLAEASSLKVSLNTRHLLESVILLVRNGHREEIEKTLALINGMGHYNHDILNCMYRLLALGYDEDALTVLLSLGNVFEEQAPRKFFRSLISQERPHDTVIGLYKRVAELGYTDSMDILGILALNFSPPEYALKMLLAMKEEGRPLRPHYFFPVLKSAVREKNISVIYEAMKHLVRTTQPGSNMSGTLAYEAVGPLLKLGECVDKVMQELKEANIRDDDAEEVRKFIVVSHGSVDEAAAAVCEDARPMLNQNLVRYCYANCNGDHERVVQILKKVKAPRYFFSGALQQICRSGGRKELEALLDAWIKARLPILASHLPGLAENLTTRGVSEEFVKKLSSCVHSPSSEVQARFSDKESWANESTEKLEQMFSDTDCRSWQLGIALLEKYCSAGNVDKVDWVKNKLLECGFIFKPFLLRKLIIFAVEEKKSVDEALQYLAQIKEQYPQEIIPTKMYLDIAALRIIQGTVDDIKAFLTENANKVTDNSNRSGYRWQNSCVNLVNAAVKHHSATAGHSIIKLVYELGYIRENVFPLLSTVMNAYLREEDGDSVVDMLDYCVSAFQKTPNFTEIFSFFIRREDPERLQRVVDMVTSIHGETKVLHQLVECFIECDKPSQARKILETPGMQTVNSAIIQTCNKFIKQRKTKELEHLVNITQNLPYTDKEEMLFQLMRGYSVARDLDKAHSVLAMYEERNITPRDRTLRYLAKVYISAKLPVPADLEAATVSSDMSPWKVGMQCARIGDMSRIVQLRQNFRDGAPGLDSNNIADIVHFLMADQLSLLNVPSGKRRNLKLVDELLSKLAQAGDVDALANIEKQEQVDQYVPGIPKYLFQCVILGSKSSEAIHELLADPKYGLRGAYDYKNLDLVLQENPVLLPKCEELVEEFVSQQAEPSLAPLTELMFQYWKSKDQVARGNELLQKYPELKNSRTITQMIIAGTKQKKDDLLLMARELCKETDSSLLPRVFSAQIIIRCREGDWQAALDLLKEAESEGLKAENMTYRSLRVLGATLTKHGQPIPWTGSKVTLRGAGRSKRQTEAKKSASVSSSSDSSDSESSDDEEEKKAASP